MYFSKNNFFPKNLNKSIWQRSGNRWDSDHYKMSVVQKFKSKIWKRLNHSPNFSATQNFLDFLHVFSPRIQN